MTRNSQLKMLFVAAFVLVALADFSAWVVAGVSTAQAEPQKAFVFSHSRHLEAGAKCVDCHKPSEADATVARPGHDSCTSCHEQWFEPQTQNKAFCTVCHTTVAEDQLPEMRSFPNYNKPSAILFDFSHKLHLGPKGKVTQVVGARVDCKTCHQFDAAGDKASFPTHRECSICHSMPEIKPRLAADSKNEDCLGCHASSEQQNPNYHKLRRFIVDPSVAAVVPVSAPAASGNALTGKDLKFSHTKHLTDSRNAGIACETCHADVDQKISISQLSMPSMWDCTMCHESSRTGSDYRISNCALCHTKITAGRAPRNHTLTERPFDHTAGFRTRHAEAAAARAPSVPSVTSFRPDRVRCYRE